MNGARPTTVGEEVRQAIRAEGQGARLCNLRVLQVTASFALDCDWPSSRHFEKPFPAGMGVSAHARFFPSKPMLPHLVKRAA